MSIQEFKPVKEGKVREVYDAGDSMIIVATDRISAFDHILKNIITKKGAILTQMSKFWFDFTKDIVSSSVSFNLDISLALVKQKQLIPSKITTIGIKKQFDNLFLLFIRIASH